MFLYSPFTRMKSTERENGRVAEQKRPVHARNPTMSVSDSDQHKNELIKKPEVIEIMNRMKVLGIDLDDYIDWPAGGITNSWPTIPKGFKFLSDEAQTQALELRLRISQRF